MPSIPEFPPPDIRDSQEVAWALYTAAALWRRGDFGDALIWLQRAAAIAAKEQSEAGGVDSNVRVVALTIAASDLAAFVQQSAAGGEHPSSVRIGNEYADAPSIELRTEDLQSLSNLPPSPLGPPPALPPRNKVLGATLPQDARRPAGLDAAKAQTPAPLRPRNAGPSQTLPDGTVNPLYAQRPTAAPITPLVIDFGPSIRSQKIDSAPTTPITPVSGDSFISIDLTVTSSEAPTPQVSEQSALSAAAPTTQPIPSDADYPPKEAVPSRPESVPTRRAEDPTYPLRHEAPKKK